MIEHLPSWLQPLAHTLLPWLPALTLLGVLMALASLIIIPLLLVKMPADYFTREEKPSPQHGILVAFIRLGRNLLALVLLVAGILMLVLPGQGLLTILIAIMASTFPGKYRLERAIMRRPGVFRAVNWIRHKYRQPPLLHPDGYHEDAF